MSLQIDVWVSTDKIMHTYIHTYFSHFISPRHNGHETGHNMSQINKNHTGRENNTSLTNTVN